MWFVGMGALKGVRDGAGARSVAPSSAWVGTADKQELPRARSREQAPRGPPCVRRVVLVRNRISPARSPRPTAPCACLLDRNFASIDTVW